MPRPRLKPAVVIVSAVLSFALMCLWSYSSMIDNLLVSVWDDEPLSISMNIHRGRAEWWWVDKRGESFPRLPATTRPSPRGITQVDAVLGFAYASGRAWYGVISPGIREDWRFVKYRQIAIPLWLILAVVSVPWLVWLRRWHRRTRQARVGFDVTSPI